MSTNRAESLKLLSKTRAKLALANTAPMAFFANICMRLNVDVVEDDNHSIQTAAVGGNNDLYLNHKFWTALTDEERTGLLAHEVMHLVYRHHTRRHDRNPEVWNIAGDLRINSDLKELGFSLPKGGVFPGDFNLPEDKTTDWYYDELMKNAKIVKLKCGEGSDPGKCGGVLDASGDPEAESRSDQMVRGARQHAEKRGTIPGSLGALLEQFGRSKIDYSEVLWPFIQSFSKDDYSWAKCNRRMISQGLYLPGMHSENLGKIVVLVDGSGSCWDEKVMQRFGSELSGILDCNPMEVKVVYHDIPVVHVDTINQGDQLVLTPKGGGGTSHVPAFKWVEENAPDALCVIALTDLYTEFPKNPPDIPVFWISIARDTKAPFGTVLHVEI